MTTYAAPAPADPFARSRICFGSLAGSLAGDQAREMTHDQLEELVGARGRELERQLPQDHLDLRAIREQEALPPAGTSGACRGGAGSSAVTSGGWPRCSAR